MQTQLPAITQQAYRRNKTQLSHSKKTPKYLIGSIKPLIKMPFERSRDFSVRMIDKMPQYNPLKDRYLQQFFRRQQRMKLLNIFSNQESIDNRQTINKLTEQNKKKDNSSYQNLVNLGRCTFLNKNKTIFKKGASNNPEQLFGEKKIKLITQPNEKSHNRGICISKDEFNNFLSKAKQKLKLSNSFKERQNC